MIGTNRDVLKSGTYMYLESSIKLHSNKPPFWEKKVIKPLPLPSPPLPPYS